MERKIWLGTMFLTCAFCGILRLVPVDESSVDLAFAALFLNVAGLAGDQLWQSIKVHQ